MPRIKCASVDCKWNSDTNMCTYIIALFTRQKLKHKKVRGKRWE